MADARDPKRRDANDIPASEDARSTAGDMEPAEPNSAKAERAIEAAEAGLADAHGLAGEETAGEAAPGETERAESADAHDVAGDTKGASR